MEASQLQDPGFGVALNVDPVQMNQEEIAGLRQLVYDEKLVILKNQKLTPAEFVDFGWKMGEVREYYEPMYHHPEFREIFVSSNVTEDGQVIGVPRTGKFWHADYAFMARPFAMTITYPQIVPKRNRGTYFIDMARAYEGLSEELKQAIEGTQCEHSPRSFFKIRPDDVYRPIGEILNEVDEVTPPVLHPTVVQHPITGEKILYISAGFTQRIHGLEERHDPKKVLHALLKSSGQLDDSEHDPRVELLTIEPGDIVIWDNRRFIHQAKHAGSTEPSKTYRVTVYDEHGLTAQPS